jgi:protein TonB
VLLEVLVNREGEVEDLRVLQSSGFQVLDRAAAAAVRKWGFEPGRKGDIAVDMWVKVPIRFRLK